MKIKVQFEFEGELPKELWWLADVDWGDENVAITLENNALVLTHKQLPSGIQLKTEFTGMHVIGTIPEQNA